MAITTTQNSAFSTNPALFNNYKITQKESDKKEDTKSTTTSADSKDTAKESSSTSTNSKADALEARNAQIQENAQNLNVKNITTQYLFQFSFNISINTQINFSAQSGTNGIVGSAKDLNSLLSSLDTSLIGYNGKPLDTLTPEEAKELVSEGGFFSVENTAERIAEFVLKGAGDDVEKLKAGREGILRGYKLAEEQWGEKLPDISQKTVDKALEKVDEKLASLGASVLNTDA